jgi:hypothetical protein
VPDGSSAPTGGVQCGNAVCVGGGTCETGPDGQPQCSKNKPPAGDGSGEEGTGDDWPSFFGSKKPDFSFGPAPRFTARRFKAPTLEEAQNEPGYRFAADEGRKSLDYSASARGDVRSGGHLKDIYSWGNKFAEQNYGNVFNRARSVFDTLFAGDLAEFSPLMEEWRLKFGANQKAGELGWDREWQNYLSLIDKYKWFNPSADAILNAELNS